jgi:xanthine dehydrogenase accessory factor
MRDFLAELLTTLDRGQECVYCTVVETRGSTPQKAGAAMLVFPDGRQHGTLGGGCVEAEVKQRALRVLAGEDRRPEILTFCLDDNYGWDDGLICGGRMGILADPLGHPPTSPERQLPVPVAGAPGLFQSAGGYFHRFADLVDQGTGCTEAVVMAAQTPGLPLGSRYLFDGAGRLAAAKVPPGDAEGSSAPEAITRHLVPLTQRPRPAVHHGIAYLPVLPRITLLIVGGGHVGQAVARLAAEVDFDIWVLDDRESYASRDRFPRAHRLLVGDIGDTLKELVQQEEVTRSTFCLIITRGHAHDEEALYHLATTPAGYVGMIGSKRKIKLIYEDLVARGVSAEALARVHAPLGFEIGSQTVPEIAVSIVAELIACRNLGLSPSPRP